MASVAAAAERSLRPPAALSLALAAALVAVAAVYWDTFVSLVSIWRRSETFAHCFLILPISLFLIWRKRGELARATFRPSALGLAAVLALSLGWLVASAAEVQVGQQLTAVLLLPAVVVAIIGTDASSRIAFPLGYLLFAVPFGEGLLPSLMDFTATFTVHALRLTGIPVLREGLYFSIPSGNFEVAEACSGLRYLIACAALGILYAHLSYRSWKKRAAFIAVSLIVPIIANGMRAYMIVMLAHWSDMRLATGVDHLIYGWLFFGGLIFVLFWAGSFFQDPPAEALPGPSRSNAVAFKTASVAGAAVLAAALAALGPYWLATVQARAAAAPAVPARLPHMAVDWRGPDEAPRAWGAAAPNDGGVRGRYSSAGGTVDVELITAAQARNEEVVGYLARALERDRAQVLEPSQVFETDARVVTETVIRASDQVLTLWHWYRIGDATTARDWHAKVLEAWNKLVRGKTDGALVVLAARGADRDAARQTLRRFAAAGMTAIDECLGPSSHGCSHGR